MSNDTKLCINCKYINKWQGDYYCGRLADTEPKFSPVDGSYEYAPLFQHRCEIERIERGGRCGLEGRFYEESDMRVVINAIETVRELTEHTHVSIESIVHGVRKHRELLDSLTKERASQNE